jgi:hypothetical protein
MIVSAPAHNEVGLLKEAKGLEPPPVCSLPSPTAEGAGTTTTPLVTVCPPWISVTMTVAGARTPDWVTVLSCVPCGTAAVTVTTAGLVDPTESTAVTVTTVGGVVGLVVVDGPGLVVVPAVTKKGSTTETKRG